MDVYKIVNIFCGICGIGVLIFSAIVKFGMIETVDPSKALLPFILGVIILLWAFISNKRHS